VEDQYLDPIHPGEILKEDFLDPMGISINRLAREVAVPPGRISEIVNGKRAISADTALRLGRFFGVSPETWLGLQMQYELRMAERTKGREIAEVVHPFAA
jgi:addiction module HigA family antidote